jgi:uncharacterized protein
MAREKSGTKLTRAEQEQREEWAKLKESLYPTQEKYAEDRKEYIANMQGNYFQVARYRATEEAPYQFSSFLTVGGIGDVLLMMLIGMALLQCGFLRGEASTGTYLLTLLLGLGLGGLFSFWCCLQVANSGFDPLVSGLWLGSSYDLRRIMLSLGWVSLWLLLLRLGWFGSVTRSLASAGRMALSNYLLTTLLCTTLFYGYGFRLFGQLSRWQMWGMAACVWIILLGLSPLWLARFHFGPAEWLWRSLSRGRRQPLRIQPALTQESIVVPSE